MATTEEIAAMARSVVERANDLRALELLELTPIGLTPEDVSSYGDSGTDDWERWRGEMPMTDINPTLDEYVGTDTSTFGGEFDWIPQWFDKLAYGDESSHQAVLDALKTASQSLDLQEDGVILPNTSVTTIQGLNEGWTGGFPTAFRERFGVKLPYPIPLQKNLIQVLSSSVKGHWNLVEGTRETLLTILTQTEAALKNAIHANFDGEYMGEGGDHVDGKKVFDVALQIIGVSLAITGCLAGAPASGGMTLAFAVSMASTAKTTVDAFRVFAGGIEVPDAVAPEPTNIAGSTVDEIISGMNDAVVRMGTSIAEEQQAMTTHLTETISKVDDLLALTDPDDPQAFTLQPYRLAALSDQPVPGTDDFDHTSG